MTWLRFLFQAIGEALKAWNISKERDAGRNEEKLDNLTKIEEKGKDADKIYNDPVLDDIDSFLLRKREHKPPYDIK